jgi:pimeloyl-ACP methyl ester carboxylesterase
MPRLRKFVIVPLALIVVLAIALAGYQAIANHLDARRFPEPGSRVDIGGRWLMLNCTGSGAPTVVLESGLGDNSTEWQAVQPRLSKAMRVCSYDRAGYGRSDAGPTPRTSAQIADDLHTLLLRAGEKPPYLLVGHSFGGYNVRAFNGKFPDEVVGVVLVDAPQEDQYGLLPDGWNRLSDALLKRYRRQAFWAPLLIDFGIARLMLWSQGAADGSYLFLQTKSLRTRANELENMRTSAEQARAAGNIAGKPLLVLTADETSDAILRNSLSQAELDRYRHIWMDDVQLRLAHLSSRGRRIIVADSGHDIPGARPDAVIAAVEQVRSMASESP